MNITSLTITPPTGDAVTLGALTFDSAGHANGYTLTSLRMDTAPRELVIGSLPLVHGSTVVGGRLGARVIDVEGLVVAPTAAAARTLRRQLVAALATTAVDPLVVSWTPEATTVEASGFIDGSVEFTDAGGPYLGYRFTILCPDPAAYQETTSTVAAGTLASPAVATNSGDAVVYPVFTVTITGTVTALRVGNSTTAEFVELSGLPAGATLVVDCTPGREVVTLDGVSILSKVATASKFPALRPGGNNVYRTVVAGAGTITAQVEWRNGWVS